MRGSAGSGTGVRGVQHKVVQECEGVRRKWSRNVRDVSRNWGTSVSGVSKKLGRCLWCSAGSAA